MKTSTIAIAGTTVALLLGAGAFRTIRRKQRRGSDLNTQEGRQLLDAGRAAFDATVAAFTISGADPHEFDRNDGRAKVASETFEATLASLRPKLGKLEARCDTLAELLQNSRLELMAFAINRKNRGTPDSAQSEAEEADRNAFCRQAEPIFAELAQALG